MSREYWPLRECVGAQGFLMEARTQFAWNLIAHFGIITGRTQGEDGAGRAVLDVMTPEETVARAFALADAFVDTAEERGGIREFTEADAEASFAWGGELDRVKSNALYPEIARVREKKRTDEEIPA